MDAPFFTFTLYYVNLTAGIDKAWMIGRKFSQRTEVYTYE